MTPRPAASRSPARHALLLPWLALLACGGTVSRAADGGAPILSCPTAVSVGANVGGSCPNPGQMCAATVPVTTCAGTTSVDTVCTCTSAVWSCPVDEGSPPCPSPPVVCPDPSTVVDGQSCTFPSALMCPSATAVLPCAPPDAGPASCTCQGGNWLCEGDLAGACAVDAGTSLEAAADGGDGG